MLFAWLPVIHAGATEGPQHWRPAATAADQPDSASLSGHRRAVAPPSLPSVTFYVAQNGKDSWSGKLAAPNSTGTDGPFATFEHARAQVQSLNKSGLGLVKVQFRAGTYFLPATEQLTAADSGTTSTTIVYENYPGESPVLSGGVRIQNWTNVSGNLSLIRRKKISWH